MHDFTQLMEIAKDKKLEKRIVVVFPEDESCLYAINQTLKENLASFIFITKKDSEEIDKFLQIYPNHTEQIKVFTYEEGAPKAVQLIREKKADILMKGMICSDILLKAILNKEKGILPTGNTLSHITIAEIPTYHKLLMFMDVAVIPFPTFEQFIQMIGYATKLCQKLGIIEPRIAMIHCNEKINAKFPHTLAYQKLKKMAQEKTWGETIIDGPMDVKTACNPLSGETKHIVSPIEGEADVLLFPDILSANTFFKTITLFCQAKVAGMAVGASCPIILSSRGDSGESKYDSIISALATIDN